MKKGIDVSSWQKVIDFTKVKNAGYEFVLLREGFGSKSADAYFFSNVKKCKKAGISIPGVYHFSYALKPKGAVKEAQLAIANVQLAGLGKDTIIFFDFEYSTVKYAATKGVELKKADCIAHTKAFCEEVERRGYKAGIYTNIDFYKNWYSKELIERYILWLADYTGGPNYPCMFQQYTEKGKVPGIVGNVDLNYYHGENKNKISVDELAKQVIDGLWGVSPDRKILLEKAGYDYTAVQNRVNELSKAQDTPPVHKKTVEEVAAQIILGKYGVNPERKQRIEDEGYNYEEVQKKVNELMGIRNRKSIDEIAKEVIRGDWGSNPGRKQRIEKEGYDFEKVQKRVNELLK